MNERQIMQSRPFFLQSEANFIVISALIFCFGLTLLFLLYQLLNHIFLGLETFLVVVGGFLMGLPWGAIMWSLGIKPRLDAQHARMLKSRNDDANIR